LKNHWQELLRSIDYVDGEKIIDIGGGMDPVPIADVVVDCHNFGRGGKSYCILDLCSEKLPFPDKYFDIAICSQTLEDLASPRLAILEMSRVAKRGIIEVPHRGAESIVNNFYNQFRHGFSMPNIYHFGTGHHKWLIEEIDNHLIFTIKVHYMLMRYPIPKWNGQCGITFRWQDSIPYGILYDIDELVLDDNYEAFRENNRRFWE